MADREDIYLNETRPQTTCQRSTSDSQYPLNFFSFALFFFFEVASLTRIANMHDGSSTLGIALQGPEERTNPHCVWRRSIRCTAGNKTAFSRVMRLKPTLKLSARLFIRRYPRSLPIFCGGWSRCRGEPKTQPSQADNDTSR